MRTTFRMLTLMLAVLAWSAVASAQTILANTTLAAACTASQTTLTLTTTATMAAGQVIVFPGIAPEVVQIQAVQSGTVVQVTRGYDGTRGSAHAAATRVFSGTPDRFYHSPPDVGGSCTRASQRFLPWIDTNTGYVWTCVGGTSRWDGSVPNMVTFNSAPPLAEFPSSREPMTRMARLGWAW